jgi:iron complex outermembrane receptor protein
MTPLSGVFKNPYRLSTLQQRVLASASIFALLVMPANFADAAEGNSAAIDEVVVTGTRVVRDGYTAPTPLSVLSASEINGMALPNVVDAVNRLPQFSSTSKPSNESTDDIAGGISNLNLRGLQPNRTLVLLDGKRLVGSTIAGFHNNGGAVDINVMPNNLISRVDVVTGGASAAYGSDALTGVVNFILDKEFIGVRAGIQGGITTYGDDEHSKVDVAVGLPFAGGRGHVLLSGEQAYNAGIKRNNRPWADRSFSVIGNPNYTASNGQPEYLAAFDTGLATATPGGLIVDGPLKGTMFGAGGVPSRFNYGPIVSGLLMSGGDWRLSRIDNEPGLNVRMKRQNAFGRVSYDATDDVQLFGEVQWAFTASRPTGGVPQFHLGADVIQIDNPFIPPSVLAQMIANNVTSFHIGTSNADMPQFAFNNERTFRRFMIGAEGKLDVLHSDWTWNAYVQRSTTHISARIPGDQINANYTLAIDAVRNGAGQIVCRSSLTNPGNGCVPYNPMGIGVNSPAAIAFVTGTGYSMTVLAQDVAAASIIGEPFSVPAGPVSLAVGVEHRDESVGGFASALDQAAAFFAGNFTATQGAYNVTEGFVETVVPIAKNTAWAKSLELNAAVRATGYSTSGYVTTWKVGGTYVPIDDLMIRATRSRDIRAPNLGDLFNAGRSSTGAVIDPADGSTASIFSRVEGNPNLQPEKADTTGVGVVLTPTFFPRFHASVDYYDIAISGAIQSLSEQQYVDLCFQGNETLCSGIRRNSAGVIDFIAIRPQNVRSQRAKGIDIEASYNFPLADIISDWKGTLTLRGLGTYVMSLKTISAQGIVEGAGVNAENGGINVAGLYAPQFKYMVSANYSIDPVAVTLTARGVSAGKYSNAFIACSAGCPTSTPQRPTINLNHIDAITYFDLAFDYALVADNGRGGANIFFTIENVLDQDPALVAGSASFGFYGGQDNQFSYDRSGRAFHAGIRFRY